MNRFSSADLEKKVIEIGTDIINGINRKKSFFSQITQKGWTAPFLSLALKNEQLKTGLFRFIDVLPSLRSDEEVIEIFLEYLGEHLEELPFAFRQGLKWLENGKQLSPLAARSIRSVVKSLSSQFILGEDMDQARPAIQRLQKTKRTVSLDLLGELTVCHSEGVAYQTRYLNLLESLQQIPHKGEQHQISVKVSSLYHRLDPADWEKSVQVSVERLRPIFRKASDLNTGIILDMESHDYKNLILKIFTTLLEEEEFRSQPEAGIAIQAYLKDSLEDIKTLIGWARTLKRPLLIRLVKGAYWDYETAMALQRNWPVPVFMQKSETDRQFETAVRLLLENSDIIRPAIGSHNVRSIAFTLACNELLELPPSHVELQMLYGMAEPLQQILAEMGYPLRVYAPVGDLLPGMAYLIRRLMENTANTSILHQTFSNEPVPVGILKPPASRAEWRMHKKQQKSILSPFSFRNEPPMDFSVLENREKIQNRLKKIVSELQQNIPRYSMIINGEKVASDRMIPVLNPSVPGMVLGKVCQASVEQGKKAVEAAQKAFPSWRETPASVRAEFLLKTGRHFQQIRHELIALEILEVGKTWKEADGDVCEAIDFLHYYAGEMVRLEAYYKTGQPVLSFPGEENQLFLQPYGILAAIPPWNFPLALATGMVAAGLVAGNCVILKPSSLSPILGSKLVETFLAEGIPPGVLQFLPGEGKEVGDFLVQHPEIPLIAFTGSKEVGRNILLKAGQLQPAQKQFKKVIAEMGGKNAILIDESADLDEALPGVLESAFGFQGQKCSACSRVIVHRAVYDHFVKRLVEAVEDLVRGDPQFPSTFLGPVIDEKARNKIRHYISTGLKEARVLYQREEEGPGYFIGPAIFENVHPESVLAREEIFGPVLSLFKAESFEGALNLANDSMFGLTGGIYSRKPSHLLKAKEAFRAGNLYINRKITGALVGRQPFGGFNLSGVGMKTGGPDYLLQFIQIKSICENTQRKGYIP